MCSRSPTQLARRVGNADISNAAPIDPDFGRFDRDSAPVQDSLRPVTA
jgi:hypothetical protein